MSRGWSYSAVVVARSTRISCLVDLRTPKHSPFTRFQPRLSYSVIVHNAIHLGRKRSQLPAYPFWRRSGSECIGTTTQSQSLFRVYHLNYSQNPCQICGIAEGLNYLHSHGIVHADLKCSNVLVSGTAANPITLLCDFGLSQVIGVPGFATMSDGSYPWMAPECIREDGGPTYASDIWSLGMTILVR